MARMNTAQVVTNVTRVTNAVKTVATWYNANPELTKEGRANGMRRAAQRAGYAKDIATARAQVDTFAKAVADDLAYERAQVFPTAKDATAEVAAELAAARVLARPGIDSAAAQALFRDMGASPARTLIMQELVARGTVKQQLVDALAGTESPRLANAKETQYAAQMVANRLTEALDGAAAALDDPTAKVGLDGLTLAAIDRTVDKGLIDAEYSAPAAVEAMQPFVDRVYKTDPQPPATTA